MRSPALVAALWLALPASGAEYDVGPGQPLGEPGDVPWESLQPGDTVRIHWRATPYAAKWVLNRAGTEAQPITVRGVPSPWGEAAKAILQVKKLPFVRVAQQPGAPNPELLEWTGQTSAPALAWGDEKPRTGWAEILLLAERLAPEPRLVPAEPAERARLFGLANDEIGYVIPMAEWDNDSPWLRNAPKRWYGEVNSIGPETAPALVRALLELMK